MSTPGSAIDLLLIAMLDDENLSPQSVAMFLEDLPELLLHERVRRKLTQKEAAAEAGVGQHQVSNYETRQRSPRLHTTLSLLRWLGHSRGLPAGAGVTPPSVDGPQGAQ